MGQRPSGNLTHYIMTITNEALGLPLWLGRAQGRLIASTILSKCYIKVNAHQLGLPQYIVYCHIVDILLHDTCMSRNVAYCRGVVLNCGGVSYYYYTHCYIVVPQ